MRHHLLALTLLFISVIDTAAQSRQFVTTPPAQPFSVYWTGSGVFLRLNTATGQIYQIQYPAQPNTISPMQRVVNASVLSDACPASGNGSALSGNVCVSGRFKMFHEGIIDGNFVGGGSAFLLLDQQSGQTWLVSLDQTGNYTFTAIPGA